MVFEIPDVCTEGSAIPVSVSHVWIVTCVKPSLECLACGACVGLLVTGVSSGHSCPVNNIAYSATYAREYQACVRILSRAGAVIGLGICCFIQDFIIMPGDLSLHIVHASITNFDGVSVANFVKRVSCWKGLPQYCQTMNKTMN